MANLRANTARTGCGRNRARGWRRVISPKLKRTGQFLACGLSKITLRCTMPVGEIFFSSQPRPFGAESRCDKLFGAPSRVGENPGADFLETHKLAGMMT